MSPEQDYLSLSDEELLAQCDVHVYKASGPGGQHRNKVSSAVRVRHKPTEMAAHGDDSRSQHTNKALAIKRLRQKIACGIRRPADPSRPPGPPLADFLHPAKGGPAKGKQRLTIGRKDRQFWPVAAQVLDLLAVCEARLADTAAGVGVSTSNLVSFLKSERHLLAAAQQMRQQFGEKPIT
jgi:hypothetical protein